ncbi:MAG: hypothetical protein BMS9Abin26_1937 [Gammaproteobacteria bacterium]|nr:MAG: hypothetical protein BMS9Abin26_1937 [Gammaproteobacteria bacterium]
MKTAIELGGKTIQIDLSKAAQHALTRRTTPLLAELELYFSCLLRKRVNFRETRPDVTTVKVNDELAIFFRPVMTRQCGQDFEGDEPPVTDFPIVNPAAFIPKWVRIDFQHGQWSGDFGY